MSTLNVVLFAGCMSSEMNQPRFKNDLQIFGDFLSQRPGVSANSLIVLISDGSPGFTFKGIFNPRVQAAYKGLLLSTLQGIAQSAQPADRFIMVCSNHGGGPNSMAYMYDRNQDQITAADVAQACSGIQAQRQAYIFGQCYSGGFIPGLASTNRVILTAADKSSVSFQTTDEQHDEFLMRVAECLTDEQEYRLANVFAAAKDADTSKDTPQLSDPGGVGSDPTLLNGP
jgi:hypothetical protein